jgi:hypothetical protein
MRRGDEEGVQAQPWNARLLPAQEGGAADDDGGKNDEGTQRQALPMVTSFSVHTLAPIIEGVDREVTPYVTSHRYRRVRDVT